MKSRNNIRKLLEFKIENDTGITVTNNGDFYYTCLMVIIKLYTGVRNLDVGCLVSISRSAMRKTAYKLFSML